MDLQFRKSLVKAIDTDLGHIIPWDRGSIAIDQDGNCAMCEDNVDALVWLSDEEISENAAEQALDVVYEQFSMGEHSVNFLEEDWL